MTSVQRDRVVVTRIDCESIPSLIAVYAMHLRFRRTVHRKAPSLIMTVIHVSWRDRRVYNVSFWPSADAIREMGNVEEHVVAAHMVANRQLRTSGAVYVNEGDWRTVLFGEGWQGPSPLDN